MARYTANGLPWKLGTKVDDCITAQDVMRKAGLDWTVKKCKLVAKMPFTVGGLNSIDELNGDFSRNGYVFRNLPEAYGTYRTDTVTPLGLVKSKYEVVQNIDAFNFFDDAIGIDKCKWDYACCQGHGERIYVSAKLALTLQVNTGEIKDPIDHYLVFTNSHDGSSSLTIMFTPVRIVCTNMLNSGLEKADSFIRIRHTESAKGKLETGAEILRLATIKAQKAKELYDALFKIKMSDDEVLKYLADLTLSDAEKYALNEYDSQNGYKRLIHRDYLTMERTDISTRKANAINNMYEYYMDGIGQQHIAGTAWGAYNAVTGFYANVANLEGQKRMESLLFGNAQNVMQKSIVSAYNLAKAS